MTITDPNYVTPFIIGSEHPTSSKTFPVVNPLSPTENLWYASAATLSDVESVTAAAAAAFPVWSATKLVKRREIILKIAELLETNSNELRQAMALETAGGMGWAEFNCKIGADLARHIAGELGGISGRIPGLETEGRAALVVKEPLGVVLAIIPWNAPVVLLLRGILYALAAGNTTIIKSSELSPRTHYLLTSLVNSAGFPPGAVNIIGHSREDAPEITKALISQRAIKKITFTGSTNVGRIIASIAGQYLKPVVMELGGKAPFIVRADADIEEAAKVAATGSFIFSGQVCMSTEKIILHSSIADTFTKSLVANAIAQFGDSQVLLVPGAQKRVKALIDGAVAGGAEIINQETYDKFDFENNKNSFPNLVLRGVTDKVDLYHQETFGPTVSVFTYDDEEEAIRIANDTDFGLASAIWTKDLKKGFAIAKRIEAGLVSINSAPFTWEPVLENDGYKNSGYGKHTLDEFLLSKVISYDI